MSRILVIGLRLMIPAYDHSPDIAIKYFSDARAKERLRTSRNSMKRITRKYNIVSQA